MDSSSSSFKLFMLRLLANGTNLAEFFSDDSSFSVKTKVDKSFTLILRCKSWFSISSSSICESSISYSIISTLRTSWSPYLWIVVGVLLGTLSSLDKVGVFGSSVGSSITVSKMTLFSSTWAEISFGAKGWSISVFSVNSVCWGISSFVFSGATSFFLIGVFVLAILEDFNLAGVFNLFSKSSKLSVLSS